MYVFLKYFINRGCRCILKIVPTDWMWDVRYEIKNSAHKVFGLGRGAKMEEAPPHSSQSQGSDAEWAVTGPCPLLTDQE